MTKTQNPAAFKFRVCASNESVRPQRGEQICRVGQEVQIDVQGIENYCFKLMSDLEYELAILAGVVTFADRACRRRLSEGWGRRFKIVMPTHHFDVWNRADVKSALREAVQFLTGDEWEFEFSGRNQSWQHFRQQILDLGSGHFVVVPYSSGLDSFAQSQLLRLDPAKLIPIRITAWNRGVSGDRDWIQEPDGTKYRRVPIPVNIASPKHAEPSYRSRSFLFAVFAGIAAKLSDAEAILIPENGQGALGPSLVSFGIEWPQRGSHPGFTRRMQRFFEALWKKQIKFEHPQLWLTKGEVLQRLKDAGLDQGWHSTSSCPRDQRDINLKHHKVHCGVCSACLLRRMSAFRAQVIEGEDTYLWPHLGATSLARAIHPDANRNTSKNDLDIAHHGLLSMQALANKANAPDGDVSIKQLNYELSALHGSDPAEIMNKIRRLLKSHQTEWDAFVNHFGNNSWTKSQLSNL